jgi:predicted PurR-regulated permease PerM
MERAQGSGRIFFFVLFALLAVLAFLVIRPFIGAILMALITVVLLKPAYDYILGRKWVRGRSRLALTITILGFLLLILIPVVIIGWLIFTAASSFFDTLASTDMETAVTDLTVAVQEFLNSIPALSDIEISEGQIAQLIQNLAKAGLAILKDLAASLATTLPNLFISVMIFLIVLATLLPTTQDVSKRIEELIPMDVSVTELFYRKSGAMVVSVVKGVFLLAILQGLVMGVFYWLASAPFIIFWTLLSMAFAILPVVGISFIVLPMAAIFLITGNATSAVIILIGFYLFVNPMDVVLRPRFVSKDAYLNFTLMLLALLGGMQLAGVLGLIYGPVIMVLLMTCIDVYSAYYAEPREAKTALIAEGDPESPEKPTAQLEPPAS